MKLLVDLIACQAVSRTRGIGRYTLELTKSLIKLQEKNQVYCSADACWPHEFENLRQGFVSITPPNHLIPYFHKPLSSETPFTGNPEQERANTQVEFARSTIFPDWILTPSLFEAFGDRSVVIPIPSINEPRRIKQAVILYDLIPLLYEDKYLPTAESKEWYMKLASTFRAFDLIFAISEASRRDALSLLNLDPDKVVTISSGKSDLFKQFPVTKETNLEILRKYNICSPFIFYLGNSDYRKNVIGAIEIYSSLPLDQRQKFQLVLGGVTSDDLPANIALENIRTIKHIPDSDLISLYNNCSVFLFPSLYEGFGLPVLEAMACGAPVLASDNSSLPEVVGREDLLFNPHNIPEATKKLSYILADDYYAGEISKYCIERSAQFSWDQCAKNVWDALNSFQSSNKLHLINYQKAAGPENVAVIIQDDQDVLCNSVINELASYNKNAQAAIDIYDPGNLTGNITNGRAQFTRRRWDQLNSRRSQYSNIIYVISVINKPVLTQIKQSPGSVVLLPSCLIRTIVNPNHPYTQQLWQIIKWADTISFLSESDVQNIQGLFRFANLPKLFTLKIQDRNTETSNAINISELLGIENSINKYGYLDKLAKSFTLSKVLNDNALRNEAKLFAANFDSRTKSRLLIDVTMTAKFDYRSGIQRVVKELTRSLVRAEFPMPEIQLVRLENQKLLTANRFIEKNHEIPQMTLGQDIEIEVKQGDSILLLDSTWEKYADFIPFLQSIRSLGGRVGTVIYDLIPVQFPQYCVDNLPSVFKKWLKSACEQSDILCCISQDVADNLSAYRLDANIAPEKEIMISSFNLGCDLSVIEHERTIRNEVTKLQKVNGHVYCVIGTLEPRKGHAFILDAFDVLWQGGSENVLIFAGKQGWKVDDLVGRINSHPLINKNLYYFVNPSDAEINLIYEKSQALISASEAEGFGLPIVEAAIHGKPSLVSDIAVFREVGGIGAIYFDRNNVDSLVKCIKEIDQMSSKSLLQMAQSVKCTSWVESSIQLLECFGFRLSPDAFDFKG